MMFSHRFKNASTQASESCGLQLLRASWKGTQHLLRKQGWPSMDQPSATNAKVSSSSEDSDATRVEG